MSQYGRTAYLKLGRHEDFERLRHALRHVVVVRRVLQRIHNGPLLVAGFGIRGCHRGFNQ
jgi:hypothetical protein